MPEFILNEPDRPSHPFYALDDFAKGYVEAMFFTNGDIGDDKNENKLNEMGVERLTRASVANIKATCSKFTGTIMQDGCFVRQWMDRAQALEPGSDAFRYATEPLDDRRCGHLFWYARQGHGVTWNDDGDSPILEALQEASQAMGESYVDAYRGWIHVN